MHEVFKTQIKKILDSHTDNSFQFIMKETVDFFHNGKITQDELYAFYGVSKIVNPISWAIFWRQN